MLIQGDHDREGGTVLIHIAICGVMTHPLLGTAKNHDLGSVCIVYTGGELARGVGIIVWRSVTVCRS